MENVVDKLCSSGSNYIVEYIIFVVNLQIFIYSTTFS